MKDKIIKILYVFLTLLIIVSFIVAALKINVIIWGKDAMLPQTLSGLGFDIMIFSIIPSLIISHKMYITCGFNKKKNKFLYLLLLNLPALLCICTFATFLIAFIKSFSDMGY